MALYAKRIDTVSDPRNIQPNQCLWLLQRFLPSVSKRNLLFRRLLVFYVATCQKSSVNHTTQKAKDGLLPNWTLINFDDSVISESGHTNKNSWSWCAFINEYIEFTVVIILPTFWISISSLPAFHRGQTHQEGENNDILLQYTCLSKWNIFKCSFAF